MCQGIHVVLRLTSVSWHPLARIQTHLYRPKCKTSVICGMSTAAADAGIVCVSRLHRHRKKQGARASRRLKRRLRIDYSRQHSTVLVLR